MLEKKYAHTKTRPHPGDVILTNDRHSIYYLVLTLIYIALAAHGGLVGGLAYPLVLFYRYTPTPRGGNRQTHPTYIPLHIFWVF